jgi:hypothetical protein
MEVIELEGGGALEKIRKLPRFNRWADRPEIKHIV